MERPPPWGGGRPRGHPGYRRLSTATVAFVDIESQASSRQSSAMMSRSPLASLSTDAMSSQSEP